MRRRDASDLSRKRRSIRRGRSQKPCSSPGSSGRGARVYRVDLAASTAARIAATNSWRDPSLRRKRAALVWVDGQANKAGRLIELAAQAGQPPHRLQTLLARQVRVDDDDIGPGLPPNSESLFTATGHTDHLDVSGQAQDQAQPITTQCVVIDQQHLNHVRQSRSSLRPVRTDCLPHCRR